MSEKEDLLRGFKELNSSAEAHDWSERADVFRWSEQFNRLLVDAIRLGDVEVLEAGLEAFRSFYYLPATDVCAVMVTVLADVTKTALEKLREEDENPSGEVGWPRM